MSVEDFRALAADIVVRLARIEAMLSAMNPPTVSDADLDSEHGNPQIRRDPRDWTGESFVGYRFSEAPPEYLRLLAGFFDWRAGKEDTGPEEKRKYARYSRLDAARARGWAKRNEAGASASTRQMTTRRATAPVPSKAEAPPDEFGADDDLPF